MLVFLRNMKKIENTHIPRPMKDSISLTYMLKEKKNILIDQHFNYCKLALTLITALTDTSHM
jgi:hypothetical protein